MLKALKLTLNTYFVIVKNMIKKANEQTFSAQNVWFYFINVLKSSGVFGTQSLPPLSEVWNPRADSVSEICKCTKEHEKIIKMPFLLRKLNNFF